MRRDRECLRILPASFEMQPKCQHSERSRNPARRICGAIENAYAFSRPRSKCNPSVNIRSAQGIQARRICGAIENAYAFSRPRSKCNPSVNIRSAQGIQARRICGAIENAYAFSRPRSKCNPSVNIRSAQGIQSRCRDQRVAVGTTVGYVELGATKRCGVVDRQNALRERWQHLSVEPGSEDFTLPGISTLDPQHADLQFEHRDRGQVERLRGHACSPREDVAVCASFGLPQLRYDVGVEQVHQVRSGQGS